MTGRRAAGAAAAILIVGATSVAVVDRYQPRRADAPPDVPSTDTSSEVLPKLPRTNVQTETTGAFTARLPDIVNASLEPPATRAPAFELRASKGTDVAIRLRDALGLAGDPELDADGVIVADTASDRVLRVVFAPGNPWSLYRGDPACLRSGDAGVAPDGRIFCELGSSGTPSMLAPRTVSSEGTRALAQSVVADLGLEARNIIVSDQGDAGWGVGGGGWGVAVETAVAGFPAIGLDIQLFVAEGGRVMSGYGMVAEPEPLGEYPLIDVTEAHARLLQWLRDAGARSPIESRRGEGPAEAPTTVVGVRLALAFSEPPVKAGTRREVSYLVPTLVLDASDGAVFPIPAVTAEHLAA